MKSTCALSLLLFSSLASAWDGASSHQRRLMCTQLFNHGVIEHGLRNECLQNYEIETLKGGQETILFARFDKAVGQGQTYPVRCTLSYRGRATDPRIGRRGLDCLAQ